MIWTDILKFSREARYPSLYSKFPKLKKCKGEKSKEFKTLGGTHMHNVGQIVTIVDRFIPFAKGQNLDERIFRRELSG